MLFPSHTLCSAQLTLKREVRCSAPCYLYSYFIYLIDLVTDFDKK